jgi:murein DD-endopeptidase MepM/ murein hydrolase activator NlpD
MRSRGLTSDPYAEPGPIAPAVSRPSASRRLKAFAIIAALPLAAMTYVGAEIAFTMAPRQAKPGSVMIDGAPNFNLRPSQGHSADEEVPLSLRRDAYRLDGDDPIGEFVAELGVQPETIEYKVASGDTLLGVLDKLNVSSGDAQSVVRAIKSAKIDDEVRMKPKQRMVVELGGALNKRDPRPLIAAAIRLDAERTALIKRDVSGEYSASIAHQQLTQRITLARGVIATSLSGAAGDQGVPDAIIANFANIYSYDVDFQRDIHPNDTFEIYYTDYVSEDGEIAQGRGDILFTRLSFGGKTKSYYRYTLADGKTSDYYDATGKSARTFLMRTPVDGARISSAFGMRKHPVLGYSKMHKGVDFAAPSGTRIYAAGAGVVERASPYGGYGNYVRIRHDNGYSTAYAHLSRFGKGIKAGRRVAQGQVIGFVGTTGRSTGPHLHYEVLKANAQINPMSVKVPTGIKLAGAELTRFKAEVARIDLAMKDDPANQLASMGAGLSRAR